MGQAAAPVVHCLRPHDLGLILVSPTGQRSALSCMPTRAGRQGLTDDNHGGNVRAGLQAGKPRRPSDAEARRVDAVAGWRSGQDAQASRRRRSASSSVRAPARSRPRRPLLGAKRIAPRIPLTVRIPSSAVLPSLCAIPASPHTARPQVRECSTARSLGRLLFFGSRLLEAA